ncbi:hypothetical protein VPH35_060811 [Triticum aestivum]
MAQEQPNPNEVVLGQEINGARVVTLNRPRQLNGINDRVVYLLAQLLEKWEQDDDAKLVIFKGAGRAFSAGGDLKMFYEGRSSDDSCLEVVYRMYWLCYHIHTYKKTTVALVNGLVMGGGAAMVAPLKFAVVTEKTVFATPEASVGLHTDCSFSYIHSRLPGYLGDESAVRAVIEEFSTDVQLDQESILNKLSTIDKCFSAETVEEILKALDSEVSVDGNQWIAPVLKSMRRSSPTGLKITLRSVREGRKQSLQECLKKEFGLTMNILRSVITGDVYEGIRALSIDKDNAPKVSLSLPSLNTKFSRTSVLQLGPKWVYIQSQQWSPATVEEVKNEDIDRVFEPFTSGHELQVPSDDSNRWSGKHEHTVYAKSSQ